MGGHGSGGQNKGQRMSEEQKAKISDTKLANAHKYEYRFPYKGSYSTTRRRMLKKYGKKCWQCGEINDGRFIQVHHIVPQEYNSLTWKPTGQGDHLEKNLAVICSKCHNKLHPRDYVKLGKMNIGRPRDSKGKWI